VPLIHKDKVLGVFDLESSELDRFNEEHVKILTPLASQVAVAIENAGLYAELRLKDARMRRELTIARRVQHGLFPEESPSGPGWEASAHFRPAQELGGDLYDFYTLGDGRLALAVGDVSGKGVPAALYGAFASGTVRARAFLGQEPAEVLFRANRALRRRGVDGFFCTLSYALFDFKARRVAIASSGMPYPLHYRAKSAQCVPVEIAGLPLGAFDDSRYEEASLPLEPGDVLVFHSDGVSESHNGKESYGLARLRQIVEEKALPAHDLGERILRDLALFMDGAEPSDDVTLVVVRIL
jgi:phosphoserine phosphatase RsbU/P